MNASSSASTSRRWVSGASGGGGVKPASVISCSHNVTQHTVVPHGSVSPSEDTEESSDLESDLKQDLKSSRQLHHQVDSNFHILLRRILLSYGSLWLVFMLVLDPPFAMYWMLVNVLIAATSYAYCHHHHHQHYDGSATNQQQQHSDRPRTSRSSSSVFSKRWVVRLTVLALIINVVVLALLREFELRDLADFETPVISGLTAKDDSSATSPRAGVHFFRIYNPRLSYTDDVEAIHQHVNAKQPSPVPGSGENQTTVQIQRYAVNKKLNAWSSDVLRYNFLLQFWRQTRDTEQNQQQQLRASAKLRNTIVCLVESDIVFDEAYFASVLHEHQTQRQAQSASLELAHIQHFWGHMKLEPFNIGILCTSSQASMRTRLWVQLMSALHSKRYRRLLYLDVLYAFVSDRLVFSWDQHHGCTEYYPHCRYIHFTRPKGDGIERAKQAIAQENLSSSGARIEPNQGWTTR